MIEILDKIIKEIEAELHESQEQTERLSAVGESWASARAQLGMFFEEGLIKSLNVIEKYKNGLLDEK